MFEDLGQGNDCYGLKYTQDTQKVGVGWMLLKQPHANDGAKEAIKSDVAKSVNILKKKFLPDS